MSLLSMGKSNISGSSYERIKLKSNTQSTGLMTERTLKTSGIAIDKQPKALPFAIKKQLFSKRQITQVKKQNDKVQKESSQIIDRLYSSLELKKKNQGSLKYFENKFSNRQNESLRCKTERQQIVGKKTVYPIEFKSSSEKNKFTNSLIQSYGVSTCKGSHNVTNNQFVKINLGLIKQFYLIECIDGTQCGTFFKENISFILLKEYFNELQRSLSKNKLNALETAVFKSFHLLRDQVCQRQMQRKDNSGCFVNALLVIDDHVLTINCGLGTSVIFTKSCKIIKGSQPHSTQNQKEMKRISQTGIQFYRTQFNVKYKQKLSIKGPLRLYPSGNTFTRIIGKSFDKIAQFNQGKSKFGNPEKVNKELAIISEPEISFLKAQDVQFMIIASSGLEEFMKMSLICSIVLHEINKYSLLDTIHELATQCSKQVLNQAYLRGLNKTATLIMVFFGLNIEKINWTQKQRDQKNFKKSEFQSPLKYIGNKKSFCKYQKP